MTDQLRESILSEDDSVLANEDDFDRDTNRKVKVNLPGNTKFEMNESNLISDKISIKDLKTKILEILESNILTRDQVKLLLKQGAEDNNLFMISEESYGKLVDALGLEIDEDEDLNKSRTVVIPKACIFKNLNFDESKIENLIKNRVLIREKLHSLHRNRKRYTLNSQSTDTLETMDFSINCEKINKNLEEVKETEYRHPSLLVRRKQELIEKVPKITNQSLKNSMITFLFILISIICFIIFGAVTKILKSGAVNIIGYGLIIARGSALAIFVFSIFLMLFVSYDLMTFCRPKCARRCLSLFDFNIYFHKICGYIVLFYSSVHSISHLCTTFMQISDPANEIYKHLDDIHGTWTSTPSYFDLLLSIPGATGIILWVAIILMWLTSFDCVKRKCFQVFAYSHVVLFPVFFCRHDCSRTGSVV